MKKCDYCMIEIDEKATVCPYCRREQKKQTNWSKYIIGLVMEIILIIIVVGGIGYFAVKSIMNFDWSSSSSSPSLDYLYPKDKSKDLSYTIEKEDKDSYSYTITGIVTNNSSSTIDYAQIEFTCYDKDNNNVGSAWANVSNLEAKGTWKFEAVYFGNDAIKCKYAEMVAR